MKVPKRHAKKNEYQHEEHLEELMLPYFKVNQEFLIINCNNKALNFFKFSKDELIGTEIFNLFLEQPNLLDIKKKMLNLHYNSKSLDEEFQILGKDQQKKWIRFQIEPIFNRALKPTKYHCFIYDISKERALERELEKKKNEYKKLKEEMDIILDHIPALIFYKDTNNNFIKVSQHLANAHNLRKEELEGKNLFDIYPKDQAQHYWEDDLEVINNKQAKLNYVEPWNTPDGQRWAQTSKVPLINTNGEVDGLIGLSVDITMRRDRENELSDTLKGSEKTLLVIDELIKAYKTVQIIEGFNHIAEQLFQQCKNLIGASAGYIVLLSEENDEYKLLYLDTGNLEDLKESDLHLSIKRSRANACRTGQVVCNNNYLDNKSAKNPEEDSIFKNILLVPLKIENKIVGIIVFANKQINFSKSDMIIAEAFGNLVISSFIKNKLMEVSRQSEERFKILFEYAPIAFCMFDLDGKFIEVNKNLEALFGYNKEEMIGKDYLELNILRSEEIQKGNKILDANKKSIPTGLQEFTLVRKDKSKIRVEIQTFPITIRNEDQILAILQNVTKREEAEEKLRRSESKYLSVIENIKEGYFESTLGARCTYCNDACCDMLGYTREEIYRLTMRDQYDEETKKFVFKAYQELYEEEKDGINIEYEFKKKDGTKIYLETSVYLKYNQKGKKVGFFGLIRDNTKRKAIEDFMEELNDFLEAEVDLRTQELQEALKEKQKYLDEILKSSQFKTNFMATMSHELRTPLNAIIGFTDLLLEGLLGPVTEVQMEYIADIKSSSEHQLDMINGILDISKIEAGQINLSKNLFSLNSIIEQVISSYRIQINKKGLEVSKIGLDSEIFIYADPVRIKEIFSNLISNALKYTIKGWIKIICQENDKDWIFKIQDTGIGIAEKDHALIFKEFKRVDSPYVKSVQGTGLGLSLIKRLIHLHRGEIWFESELDKGSTFIFNIPKEKTDIITKTKADNEN
ncbi:MAG: PAS domain S-box protein [Promethearchaeota archaeon]